MSFPSELKYTREHEWIRVEGNEATVGITNYAQKELGDIVFVEIETEGESLEQEEVFGTIEAVKTVADLFMPVDGKVVEVNVIVQDSPEAVNTDPYGEGWLIKIIIEDSAQLDELMTAEEYEDFINE